MPSSTKQIQPVVSDVKEWANIAATLIKKGYGQFEWSGLTLDDWHAVLCSLESKFIKQSFAVQAVKGIASQFIRDQIGEAADRLWIELDIMPAAGTVNDNADQAVA